MKIKSIHVKILISAFITAVAAVGGIAYAVHKHNNYKNDYKYKHHNSYNHRYNYNKVKHHNYKPYKKSVKHHSVIKSPIRTSKPYRSTGYKGSTKSIKSPKTHTSLPSKTNKKISRSSPSVTRTTIGQKKTPSVSVLNRGNNRFRSN